MTPWVSRLIATNVVMFLVTNYVQPQLQPALALLPAAMLVRPWTIVTYMFLHANIGHIFFNMLALYFFGPRLELMMGGPNFISLYFASGICGALLSLATPGAFIVGASGAVFGVMLAYARFWPHDRIFIYGLFPVEARVLVLFMTVVSLFGGSIGGFGRGDNTAHFAHLGGFAGGWLY